jgi:hypothetical protein
MRASIDGYSCCGRSSNAPRWRPRAGCWPAPWRASGLPAACAEAWKPLGRPGPVLQSRVHRRPDPRVAVRRALQARSTTAKRCRRNKAPRPREHNAGRALGHRGGRRAAGHAQALCRCAGAPPLTPVELSAPTLIFREGRPIRACRVPITLEPQRMNTPPMSLRARHAPGHAAWPWALPACCWPVPPLLASACARRRPCNCPTSPNWWSASALRW